MHVLAALMVIVLITTSCSGEQTGERTPQPAPLATAQSSIPRETMPKAAKDDIEKMSAGNSTFAFDLYQAIRDQSGNLFFSPYSISVALAMTYAGARGNTERQMAETLHLALPQDQLHPALNALDLQLTSANGFTLTVANSIWGQNGYSFRKEFLDTLAKNYGSGLGLLDFVDEAKREQSRLIINQWVSEETQGKIKDLIATGNLTRDTRLVLANAIYFKAEWQVPFLNGTRNDTFTLLDGNPVTVPMMSRRTETRYAEGAGYQAVEIAYKGERMRMIVLLPAPGQFEAFEQALTSERIGAILQSLEPTDLQLLMPKFKYETGLSLAKTLMQMGMTDAFTPGTADFSGMDGTRNLYVSQVVHKAFVAVDEIGTEAAAATGVVVGIVSMPVVVKLDRPFVFIIRDAESGAILFAGRVLDPRG